jgi:Flp pilus assembly protein TadD
LNRAGPEINRSRCLRIAALIVLAVAVVFGRVGRHEFTSWDDAFTISRNPSFNPPTWQKIGAYWTAVGRRAPGGLYVPLTYTAWGALAKVAWSDGRLAPWAFHAASVALHALGALAVFAIARRLVGNDWAAAAGALVWALHPVQVEAVAWASGLKDVLCGLLALVALWQLIDFARARQAAWAPALGTLAYVAALLAKPTAVVVPVIALILWCVDPNRDGARTRSVWLTLAVWFALAVPSILLTRASQSDFGIPTVPWHVRPLVAAHALAFYAYKLVWPVGLTFDYGLRARAVLRQEWVSLAWFAPIALVLILLVARRRAPLICTGVLIFVAGLLPVFGFVPFQYQGFSTVADHYLYIPMLGPALAAAWLVRRAAERYDWRVVAGASTAVIVALGAMSYRQVGTWRDDDALFAHAMRISPVSAHADLAYTLQQQGRLTDAASHYYKALELGRGDGDDPFIPTNLGLVLLNTGNAAAAEQNLRRAVALDANDLPALAGLGALHLRRGEVEPARTYFARVAALAPHEPAPLDNLAMTYALEKRHDAARRLLEDALRLDPAHVPTLLALCECCANLGDWDAVERHARRLIGIDASQPAAHNALGVALLRRGQLEAAVAEFAQALRLQPDLASARQNLETARQMLQEKSR